MGCGNSSLAQQEARQRLEKERNEKILKLFVDQVEATFEQETLDMRGIVMLLWKAKDKPEFARIVADLVSIHAAEVNSFRGIEFYLPQIVHMLVHLEVDWGSDAVLEQLMLFIAQQSLQIALQFGWILYGLLEDYQVEDGEGKANPRANVKLYDRCSMLLQKLELCVVYGSPMNSKFKELYNERRITLEELMELETADRRFHALRIAAEVNTRGNFSFEGQLLYKRWKKRGGMHREKWIMRKVIISRRVLYCCRLGDNAIKRSILLDNCRVVRTEVSETQFIFEVDEIDRERKYILRASSKEEMENWINAIQKAIASPPHDYLNGGREGEIEDQISSGSLSSAEIARYGFFKTERNFIRRLTDICEELRFVEIPLRKEQLREKLKILEVPGCVYIPLCGSTDPWKRVVSTIPANSSAFSTRERCPCLMAFEVTSDDPETEMDVSTYLYQTLGFDAAEILDDDEVEMLEKDQSVGSKRALIRDSFARSARNSVTKLDLSGLHEDGRRHRGSTLDQPPNLWKDSSKAKEGKEGESEHPNRQRWKAAALMIDAAHHLQRGSHGDCIPHFDDSAAKALTPEERVENSALVERPSRGLYLSALGKFWLPDGAQPESQQTPENDGRGANPTMTKQMIIAKSNDDLRQEVFIMQLIRFLHDIWLDKGLKLYLNPYRIMSTAQTCGLIELVKDSTSFDGLKKDNDGARIGDFLKKTFPDPGEFDFVQRNFVESMAGYSAATYILGIKDRHNGNVMLNLKTGHVTHIDFGFVLGMAPGKDKVKHTDFSLERAAFKMTPELVEAMGGKNSQNWEYFITLVTEGIKEARRHADTLETLIEITGYTSKLPCFNQPGGGVKRVIKELKQRLMLGSSDKELAKQVRKMCNHAANSSLTLMYEKFQKRSNGIQPCL